MIYIPYGGTTGEQDKKIEKMVAAMMSDPKFQKKYPDAKTRKSHAIAIAKSKVMGKEGLVLENVAFRFSMPLELTESAKDSDFRTVKGTLLVPTTSRNNVTYEAEEISKATFNGQIYNDNTNLTMSLNHSDDVTDNIGIWKPIRNEGKIEFEAKVFNTGKHPYVLEMFDKKLIRYVSVEALAKQLISDGESVRAVGLDITGMGAVKTPGIIEAHAAIAEAFNKFNEEDLGEDMEKTEEATPAQESSVDKLVATVNTLIANDNKKVEELTTKIKELETKIKEKETKGQVTQENTKPRFEMIKESNKFKPGTKDFYATGIVY